MGKQHQNNSHFVPNGSCVLNCIQIISNSRGAKNEKYAVTDGDPDLFLRTYTVSSIPGTNLLDIMRLVMLSETTALSLVF